jgi:hypothetical protein
MAIEKDVLDQLLAGRDPEELFGKDGLIDELEEGAVGADAFGRAGRSPGN